MTIDRLLFWRPGGWRKRDLAGISAAVLVGAVYGGAVALKHSIDAYLDVEQ
jgi:hypothetical protein